YDEVGGRYRGLRAGQALVLSATDPGVVVKAEVARRQLDAEVPTPTSPGTGVGTGPAPGARIAERRRGGSSATSRSGCASAASDGRGGARGPPRAAMPKAF